MTVKEDRRGSARIGRVDTKIGGIGHRQEDRRRLRRRSPPSCRGCQVSTNTPAGQVVGAAARRAGHCRERERERDTVGGRNSGYGFGKGPMCCLMQGSGSETSTPRSEVDTRPAAARFDYLSYTSRPGRRCGDGLAVRRWSEIIGTGGSENGYSGDRWAKTRTRDGR